MLKPRKRLTKKKLKEDKLVTFYYNATQWVEDNSRYIYIGVAVIAAIIIGTTVYRNKMSKSNQAASVQYLKATHLFQNQDYQQALTAFSTLAENYKGTNYAKLGRYYLGRCFYATGDYDNAEQQFTRFLSSYKKNKHLLSAAMGNIAACYEQEGEHLKAAQQYEKAVKKYSESVLNPSFLLKAGRNYQKADETEKARLAFQRIVDEYPDSMEKNDAIMYMQMLNS